jgi:hypothetical protein
LLTSIQPASAVENATTHAAYALDTGISLNTLLPTGSLQTGAVLEGIAGDLTGYTAAASSAFQSFLASNRGSGLLGLFGVSRRRVASVGAAACG